MVAKADIENPEIEAADVVTAEIDNGELERPEIENPQIEKPEIDNPEVESCEIDIAEVESPEIVNAEVENVTIENVTIANLEIDRETPRRCPSGRTAMRQHWAHLLFLHWEVDVAEIQKLLPPGLTVDTYEGRAFVGLVPFTMTGVRPNWAPAFKPLSDFHETNVRTYVHRDGKDPGVWFFSLDAANVIAVKVARAAWKLPYHYARMSLEKKASHTTNDTSIEYATDRLWPGPLPGACNVKYAVHGDPTPGAFGSLEFFLAERYILYTKSKGILYSGQVHHVPYPLQKAEIIELSETLIAAAGIERPQSSPLAHYASELTVRVFPLRPVR